MLFMRILPEITPVTRLLGPVSLTLNMALGSTSITSPSILIPSSLAKFKFNPFQSIPAKTSPGADGTIPNFTDIRIVFFY